MIGHNIKYYRQRAKLTQLKLEEMTKIDKSTISRYETEDIDIPISAIVKIARAVGVKPMKLMEGVK